MIKYGIGRLFRPATLPIASQRFLSTTVPIPAVVEDAINPPRKQEQVGRRKLTAVIRTARKTRQNQKLREQGLVPGVVHGVNDNGSILKRNISINMKDLSREIRELGISIENTAYDLVLQEADGGTSTFCVTPRQLTTDPMTGDAMSVNFLKFQAGQRMRIPMRYINTDLCVDLKRGCFLLRVNQFVECVCEDPDSIPKFIDVDVSKASKGSVLTMSDLIFPSCVKPSRRTAVDFVAGVIKSK